MFKEGNLVRLITEAGDSEVMRVLEDSGDNGTTYVSEGDDEGEGYFSTDDLELVTDDQEVHEETKPMIANINTLEDFELTDQFNRYIISVIQSLRARGCEEKIDITVKCQHFAGESAEIEYGVGISYDADIYSDNLGKSGHIALTRREEAKALKVKAIPMYLNDEKVA
jgi:hypothetical protein